MTCACPQKQARQNRKSFAPQPADKKCTQFYPEIEQGGVNRLKSAFFSR
jgi:hypothetical protein